MKKLVCFLAAAAAFVALEASASAQNCQRVTTQQVIVQDVPQVTQYATQNVQRVIVQEYAAPVVQRVIVREQVQQYQAPLQRVIVREQFNGGQNYSYGSGRQNVIVQQPPVFVNQGGFGGGRQRFSSNQGFAGGGGGFLGGIGQNFQAGNAQGGILGAVERVTGLGDGSGQVGTGAILGVLGARSNLFGLGRR